MASLCLGIVLALIVALIVIPPIYNYFDYFINNHIVISVLVLAAILIVIVIISFFGFSYHFSMCDEAEIESYNIQKQTIEQAIHNANLGGLERIELVNNAKELNAWLAEQKVKINKWSNFDIKQNIKDLYSNAEYISLE